MKVLHICLCCNSYNDGWNYQENCLPYYHKQLGHEVTVITVPFIKDINSNEYIIKIGEYKDQNGLKIIRKDQQYSNKSRISRRLRIYRGVYDSLKNEQPDIIFVHGCQFLDIRHIVRYAKNNPDVKIYVDGHEDCKNSAQNWISRNILHGIIWKYCARLIEPYTIKFWGVLPARVDFLVDMYNLPKDKVELLVMGAEDEKVEKARKPDVRKRLRKQYGISDDDFLVVSGGRLDNNKVEILTLMKAVNEIAEPKLKMIFFGSVNEEYHNDIKKLLTNRVQAVGWVNPIDTYNYLAMADIVAFPGLHSVFWEQAVGTGLPCIFRHMEGFTHVDLGGNCLFFENDSIEEMKKKVLSVFRDESLIQSMKANAENKGISYFSYRQISRKAIES